MEREGRFLEGQVHSKVRKVCAAFGLQKNDPSPTANFTRGNELTHGAVRMHKTEGQLFHLNFDLKSRNFDKTNG
jgi:hypothetical protein